MFMRMYGDVCAPLSEWDRSERSRALVACAVGKSFGLSVTIKSALPVSAHIQNGSSPGPGEIALPMYWAFLPLGNESG